MIHVTFISAEGLFIHYAVCGMFKRHARWHAIHAMTCWWITVRITELYSRGKYFSDISVNRTTCYCRLGVGV